MSNHASILADTALATLKASCKEYFVLQFCLSLIIASLGLIWLMIIWISGVPNLFSTLVGAVFLSLGLYAAHGVWQMRELVNKKVLENLTLRPEQIVWLYKSELQLLPFGIALLRHARLHIGLLDGDMQHIRASAKSIDVFIQLYALAYEHVTTGYHPENEQLFRSMPALLKKDSSDK